MHIFLISHCILNQAAKVRHRLPHKEPSQAERCREGFLDLCRKHNCQLLQLPCPEMLLYGLKRWGHTRDQFDRPMFRACAREWLELICRQVAEYDQAEDTTVLGVVGIDGSPSCGVHFTYAGDWGGELSTCPDLPALLAQGHMCRGMGVFMEEFAAMLQERKIDLPFFALTEENLVEIRRLLCRDSAI